MGWIIETLAYESQDNHDAPRIKLNSGILYLTQNRIFDIKIDIPQKI
jgi:hypothetical protein